MEAIKLYEAVLKKFRFNHDAQVWRRRPGTCGSALWALSNARGAVDLRLPGACVLQEPAVRPRLRAVRQGPLGRAGRRRPGQRPLGLLPPLPRRPAAQQDGPARR